MSFLEWLEFSALSEWVATSSLGYPMLLGLHSVGMAIVVGILLIINLRVLGFFPSIPVAGLRRSLKLAWAGFIINLCSGLALFMAQATFFITHIAFIVKIIAILLALINAALLQNILRQQAHNWGTDQSIPLNTRIISIFSLLLWVTAIISGRLIAYI